MTDKEIQDILRAEALAITQIPVTDGFNRAIELITERVHRGGGKLITSGMGKAGQIAMNIATTFCSTGTPAVFLHPAEAQHGDLGIIQPNDMLLLLSNSGKTREVIELTELARALNPGMPMIVITGDAQSILAGQADVMLHTGGAPEVCPLGMTPTTSTTLMTVMGDILVTGTMKAIGFTARQYAMRHHGGYLGALSAQKASE